MHGCSKTGWLHSAGRLLNPAFRKYDHDSDDQTTNFVKFLRHFFDDAAMAKTAFEEWQDYKAWDLDCDLFYETNPDGSFKPDSDENKVEKLECSWEGELRGLGGADWWIKLPYELQMRWENLRAVAKKVLSQTSTESAAERHFSAVEVIQPKIRASLSAESVRKRTFVRAEIAGELAAREAVLYQMHNADDLDAIESSGIGHDAYHDYNAIGDNDALE